MRITSRARTTAFFITLGSFLVALTIYLNVSWIVLNWREVVPLVLGIIFFGVIIAGMVLTTIFLVREVRRNEQQDSFLNAVTHELKTPITSLRLYLQTLERRNVDEKQRRDFYRLMLEDTDRLLGTVEQVLKASEIRYHKHKKAGRTQTSPPSCRRTWNWPGYVMAFPTNSFFSPPNRQDRSHSWGALKS